MEKYLAIIILIIAFTFMITPFNHGQAHLGESEDVPAGETHSPLADVNGRNWELIVTMSILVTLFSAAGYYLVRKIRR